MLIKKLTWAGIAVESENNTILIDPLGDLPRDHGKKLVARLGDNHQPIIPLSSIKNVSAILITHIHPDHFDFKSILSVFSKDIPLLIPLESAEYAKKLGFTSVVGLNVGEYYKVCNFVIKASYSVDGYGTPQVSWIVESNNNRMIHCGDTLWHGYWWKMSYDGPFDVACLPINGPILNIDGLNVQSTIHAAMTPEEAVEAAKILGAKIILPIHYETFNNPPYYCETPLALERLREKAINSSIQVKLDSILLENVITNNP